jgi:hypothetical protein
MILGLTTHLCHKGVVATLSEEPHQQFSKLVSDKNLPLSFSCHQLNLLIDLHYIHSDLLVESMKRIMSCDMSRPLRSVALRHAMGCCA